MLKQSSCKAAAAVFILMISLAAGAGVARASENGRKLVVVVADNIGFNDWATPTLKILRKLEKRGALGLMVTRNEATPPRAVSKEIESGAYLTLGSGLSAAGDVNGPLAFNYNEQFEGREAGIEYSLRTGQQAPLSGIIHLGVGAFQAKNKDTQWLARPGALGSLLRDAGFRTAAIGNADLPEESERGAAIMAMDEAGRVDFGDISANVVMQDPMSPMGWRTNIDAMKKVFADVYSRADFIVVDYGDTNRIDRFGAVAAESVYVRAKEDALRQLGGFIEWLSSAVDLNTTQILVVAPTPPRGSGKLKDTLTPVFAFGAGIEPRPSLLTARSTRRPGLVKNTDFAAHVINYFGIAAPPDFIGSPLTASRDKAPLDFLKEMHDRDVFVESQIGLLKVIIIWHLIVLLIAFLTALRLDKTSKLWRGFMTALMLWTASMFLSFMILAGIPQIADQVVFTASFFGIAALVALSVGFIPGYQWKIFALACIYVTVLTVDQLTGAKLISHALLGYYPQVGARFYGIGNEYMGFMVGAPLVIAGVLLDAVRGRARTALKAGMAVLFLGVVVIVGAPFIGANFGGLISCLFAFLFMVFLLGNGRLNWKTFALVSALVVIFCCASVFIEMRFLGSESHVARLMERIAGGGGFAEFIKIVVRKLSVNMRLLRNSFWSALFVVTLAVTLALYYFPVERMTKVFEKYEYFRRAFLASLTGALAAFLFNDSGIVPATTAMILPASGVFMLLFNQPAVVKKKYSHDDRRRGGQQGQSGGRKPEGGARSIVLKESDKNKPSAGPAQKPKQGGQESRPEGNRSGGQGGGNQQRRQQQGGGGQKPYGGGQGGRQGGQQRDDRRRDGDGRPQQSGQGQQQRPPQQGQQQTQKQNQQGDGQRKPAQGGGQDRNRQQQGGGGQRPQQQGGQGQNRQQGGGQGSNPQGQSPNSNRPRRRRPYRPPQGPQGPGGSGNPGGQGGPPKDKQD
ncbi:MAG: hypothetical protein WCX65_07650 [bacterium]